MYPFHVPYYSLSKLDAKLSSSSSSSSSDSMQLSAGKRGPQGQGHQSQNQRSKQHNSHNSHSLQGYRLQPPPPFRERPPWFRTSSPVGHRGQHTRAAQSRNAPDTQNTQNTQNGRPLQAHTQYESGYYDGERDGLRAGLVQGRQEGADQGRTEGYRAGQVDGFTQGHQQGHQQGFEKGFDKGHEEGREMGHHDYQNYQNHQNYRKDSHIFSDGYKTGFLDAFEKGYYQGCSDGFFQLYSIYPDSNQARARHGDPKSPYAGNTVEIYAGCSGGSSLLGTAGDAEVPDVAPSDTGTVIHTVIVQPGQSGESADFDNNTTNNTNTTDAHPEHITWLTPVSPSAPLVRVASAPSFREMAALARPQSAQGQLCYSETTDMKGACPAEETAHSEDSRALAAHTAPEAPHEPIKTHQREAVLADAQGMAAETAEIIHVGLAKDDLPQTGHTGHTGHDEESMFMPAYTDDGEEYRPEEPQNVRPQALHDNGNSNSNSNGNGNGNDNEDENKTEAESDSLVHVASPRSAPPPAVFSSLFIFPYQCYPVLGYPSPLSHSAPTSHFTPDQDHNQDHNLPKRSEYITESYAEFHQRQRHTGFSVYEVDPERLTDRIGIVRKAADTMADEEKSLSAFPAVFRVSGSLEGPADMPPVVPPVVPEHAIYKYAVHPYELAKCVHHSLTTCPMCAITPSYCFLGPGESIDPNDIFRLGGARRYPPGGSQETPSGRMFSEVREYTYPVGFGFGVAKEGLGVAAQETALSEIQHPDEADPGRSRLFDPRLDEEVLGRAPTSEDIADAAISFDDAKDSLPDTHYCLGCGGLAWLKTTRRYCYTRDEPKEEEANKEAKRKHQKKAGKRAKRDKGKAKHVQGKSETGAGADADADVKQLEVTLGTRHPSHHASFNEHWSLYKYWTKDDTAAIYPEESGTTRSLFVQVAALARLQNLNLNLNLNLNQSDSVLSAYFGPGSLFNSCIAFDLATATDGDGRLLRDLPFERFNRNAPHLAAVALALYQVWTGVVPSHRMAIDTVTRWNSDHSRRKAYRFRVVVVTPSAYVVDLLGSQFHEKWQRHLFYFDTAEAVSANPAIPANPARPANPAIPTEAPATKKTSPAKKKKKKSKAKKARERAKKAETKKKRAEQAAAEGREKEKKRGKQEKEQKEEDGMAAQFERDFTVYEMDKHAAQDRDAGVDVEADGAAFDAPDAPDDSEYYYGSRTPSSCASARRFSSAGQPAAPEDDDTWRVLADLAEALRDATDFERPGVGRYVYADTRDLKRLLPNGVLVHLVVRYMELLRWHGVHVAFYHARESTTTAGAQGLASSRGR